MLVLEVELNRVRKLKLELENLWLDFGDLESMKMLEDLGRLEKTLVYKSALAKNKLIRESFAKSDEV